MKTLWVGRTSSSNTHLKRGQKLGSMNLLVTGWKKKNQKQDEKSFHICGETSCRRAEKLLLKCVEWVLFLVCVPVSLSVSHPESLSLTHTLLTHSLSV